MSSLVVGNWKMQLDVTESETLAKALLSRAFPDAVTVVVCPSFDALDRVGHAIGGSAMHLGAQDLFWEKKGAFTGEVSTRDLLACGVSYVLVGHSERRHLGETNEMVAKKYHVAREAGLIPILCVGETAEEKTQGVREDVVRTQLGAVFAAADVDGPVVIAYEPVWAIGTGLVCPPNEASAVHAMIRREVRALAQTQATVTVLYGGSVDGKNASQLAAEAEIEGVLVGGASLRAEDLHSIAEAFSHK